MTTTEQTNEIMLNALTEIAKLAGAEVWELVPEMVEVADIARDAIKATKEGN